MTNRIDTTIQQLEEKRSVRRAIRRKIKDADHRMIVEERTAGYNAFVQPFVDVLKAARLLAMDVSNSLRMIIVSIFSFDKKAILSTIRKFDQNRQKINNEWAPLVEDAKKTIGGVDPILKMAILGPSVFFATQGIGAALTSGKTIAEIFMARRWDELVNSFDENFSEQQMQSRLTKLAQWYNNRGDGDGEDRVAAIDIVGKLEKLFMLESMTQAQPILEQSEKQQKKQDSDFTPEEATDIFIEVTGLDKAFVKLRKESFANIKTTISSLLDQLRPLQASFAVFAAKDLQSLQKSLQDAKSQGMKIDASAMSKIENTVKSEAKKLAANKQFLERLKKEKGHDPSPDEIANAAMAAVFNAAKEKVNVQIAQELKNAIETTESVIKNLRIDASTLETLKKSPTSDAHEISAIYEELLKIYKNIKDCYSSQVK